MGTRAHALQRQPVPVHLTRCSPPCRSCGGVAVTSMDGRIVCANTLDERIRIAYNANLPDIRTKLFGAVTVGQH